MNEITLLMVNWNQQPCIELALNSYVKYHYAGSPLRLLLVDNGSTDGSKEWLTDNGVPFVSLEKNIGHENALNYVYSIIDTKYVLLVDSDVEFKDNVYSYLQEINGDCISVGELIDKNWINDVKIKDRISPWFWIFRYDAMSDLPYFRDPSVENWTYDVGSWFTEKLLERGTNFHVERLNTDQDGDIVSMQYEKIDHIGKVSWDVFEKHQDRIDEVMRRRNYIRERILDYSDIDLKNKFV